MASETQDESLPAYGWEVDSIRFTSFISSDDKPTGLEEWWRSVSGQAERTVQLNPTKHEERGSIGEEDLILRWERGRVDWLLHPKQPEQDEEDQVDFLSVGRLEPALKRFRPFLDEWFKRDDCPSSNRMALGTILLKKVQTRQEGYELLDPLLPAVKLDVENTSDFIYRINRPRDSRTVEGLKINRLSNWIVWIWQRSSIKISIGPHTNVQETAIGEQRLACKLELDISTAVEYNGEFEVAQQEQLLDEMTAMATEIATQGDIS